MVENENETKINFDQTKSCIQKCLVSTISKSERGFDLEMTD